MLYRTLNPATEELIREYETHSNDAVENALELAIDAFADWRKRPISDRAARFLRLAEELLSVRERFARLMSTEMGKPFHEGIAEIEKCAWACRFYAEEAEGFLAALVRPSDAGHSYVRYDALGPILAIMPWNFPIWQTLRFGAPSMMAGNVTLLKHSPNTPGCAEAIETVFQEAGFPEGILQNLRLSNDQAAALISDFRLRGVTLTGSTRAGRQVAEAAGRGLKKMVLELGGSDPFIVLEDADLSGAVQTAVTARCLNSGQSCIASKRFLVQETVADEFEEAFSEAISELRVGDPMDPATQVGPLARQDLLENLSRQVDESVLAGARVVCGGRRSGSRGYYFEPTILSDIPAGCPAANEELFGPVAALHRFSTDQEALSLANDTEYGLGASLWTRDLDRARGLIPLIDAGAVFVNGLVKSDPRLPFGGVKNSGFGRELAREGILEFVNSKTVWIR